MFISLMVTTFYRVASRKVRAGLYLHISAEAMEKHDSPVLWFAANDGSQFAMTTVMEDSYSHLKTAINADRLERTVLRFEQNRILP